MHSRYILHVLTVVPLWFLFTKAQDESRTGLSCLTSSASKDGQTRITFLREDPAGARSLYLTQWSGDRRLVACEVHSDPLMTERYHALCDASGSEGLEIRERFNVSMALDSPCARGSSGAPKFTGRAKGDGTEAKSRRKRSWYFPGTLWCGTGTRAAEYNQLGMFESADRCCREHDHCLHIIPAFKVNYGVFNPHFYTVSHCDCDRRFRHCLAAVNDSIANMVGYSFFSFIKVPCFDLTQRRRCTEMHWWGGCRLSQYAPNAIFKNPLPYNASEVLSKNEDIQDTSEQIESNEVQNVTGSPTINANSSQHKHRCSTRHPTRGDNFHITGKKGKGCKRHRKLHKGAPSEIPPVSRTHTTIPPMKNRLLNASTTSALMSNKHRTTDLLATPRQTSKVQPQVTTNPYPQRTLTQSVHNFIQKPALMLNLTTTIPAMTKTTKSHTTGHGGVSEPHCRNCSGEKTLTPSTTPHRAPINMTVGALQPKNELGTSRPTLRRTTTPAAQITTTLRTPTSTHKHNKTNSPQLWNNTSNAQKTRPRRPLTDNHTMCGSLKLLDECKYKIPPMEMKYDLQNTESKTSYHCDCTTSLAVRIGSSPQARTLPKLLMDFVAQQCFTLPKKKKCHSRKRCSGGFTKASDLLLVLKKIEEKDAAGVRNSGSERKRGIPVRLYKRCLRLQREAEMMAQLTRL